MCIYLPIRAICSIIEWVFDVEFDDVGSVIAAINETAKAQDFPSIGRKPELGRSSEESGVRGDAPAVGVIQMLRRREC
jgi:hypothetical protein